MRIDIRQIMGRKGGYALSKISFIQKIWVGHEEGPFCHAMGVGYPGKMPGRVASACSETPSPRSCVRAASPIFS